MAIRLDHGTDELFEVHDINVTPFIDVMLVLLIIFMVAAPLATVDVPSSSAPPQQRPPKPVYLTLKADGSLALGDNPVTRDALADLLASATNGDKEERIFLRGDRAVPYGEVMGLMNDLRRAGYLKVALVGMELREGK